MSFHKTILIIFIVLNINHIIAQSVESYKWKSRVLLVLTSDVNNPIYKNQIKELQAHKIGLKERKLIVFQITKDAYKVSLTKKTDWQQLPQAYRTYKKTKSDFEVLLIGLDGGIKLRETDLITSKSLFSLIDVMPMRKFELNEK